MAAGPCSTVPSAARRHIGNINNDHRRTVIGRRPGGGSQVSGQVRDTEAMPVAEITRAQTARRASLVRVRSYDVELDFTRGE